MPYVKSRILRAHNKAREIPRDASLHHHLDTHRVRTMDASFLAVLFAFLISALGMENGTFLGVVLVFAYYPLRY